MSNGRLKASTNRVRTSVALHQTSIWTSAIGVEKFENSNAAIEATLNAPGVGGQGRKAKQLAAQQAVQAAGGFDGVGVDSYQGLIDLARSQGALGGLNRGACKKCGQLGHLTKQCRNTFSRFFDGGAGDKDTVAAAAAEAGVPAAAVALAPLVEDGADGGELPSSSDSMAGLEDSDDSSSSTDSEAARRQRKERKRKRKEKERRRKEARKVKVKRHSSKTKRHSTHSKKRRRHSPTPNS